MWLAAMFGNGTDNYLKTYRAVYGYTYMGWTNIQKLLYMAVHCYLWYRQTFKTGIN